MFAYIAYVKDRNNIKKLSDAHLYKTHRKMRPYGGIHQNTNDMPLNWEEYPEQKSNVAAERKKSKSKYIIDKIDKENYLTDKAFNNWYEGPYDLTELSDDIMCTLSNEQLKKYKI